MKRRSFLKGLGVATALPVAPVVTAHEVKDAATDPAQVPQGAVFQQQAYFAFDGTAERYTPPAGNKSTQDYRASLSKEEFLRRHWFS
ncbi:MAG: hypothetical protein FD165_2856 [Gammaproteobacteria bacterium]|nr:MAG: hypothetical protein FD165_2856 [Gammaproteobacteria bacterium]